MAFASLSRHLSFHSRFQWYTLLPGRRCGYFRYSAKSAIPGPMCCIATCEPSKTCLPLLQLLQGEHYGVSLQVWLPV